MADEIDAGEEVELGEKAATDIPVDMYTCDQDFDDWIECFEFGVTLATRVTGKARKETLFRKWLPLKLDDNSRILLGKCKEENWELLKAELKDLMVDPQERYEWRSGRIKVEWDGKERFHVFETRVRRKVDRLEKNPRECDYFHTFRRGLPPKYVKAIDLGVNAETIEEAKRVAMRYHTAQGEKEAKDATSKTAFTGAAMSDDRLEAIQLSLQGMKVTFDNLGSSMKKFSDVQSTMRNHGDRHQSRSIRRGYSDERDDDHPHYDSQYHHRRDSPYPRYHGGPDYHHHNSSDRLDDYGHRRRRYSPDYRYRHEDYPEYHCRGSPDRHSHDKRQSRYRSEEA